MAQDGTATAIRPRHRRDPRGSGLRSGRHRQDVRRTVPHGEPSLVPAPAPALTPALAVEAQTPAPALAPDGPVDAAAMLPWLVVLGLLGLLGMVLTSLA